MATDWQSLPRALRIVLVVGLLAFVATFLPFDGIHENGIGADENAWHGVAGVFGALALTAAVAALVLDLVTPGSLPKLTVSWNFVVAALGAFSVLMFVVHWLSLPHADLLGVRFGLSIQWGGVVLLILSIGFTLAAVSLMRERGERMPWETPPSAD